MLYFVAEYSWVAIVASVVIFPSPLRELDERKETDVRHSSIAWLELLFESANLKKWDLAVFAHLREDVLVFWLVPVRFLGFSLSPMGHFFRLVLWKLKNSHLRVF